MTDDTPALSDGQTVMAEVIGSLPGLLPGVAERTIAEYAGITPEVAIPLAAAMARAPEQVAQTLNAQYCAGGWGSALPGVRQAAPVAGRHQRDVLLAVLLPAVGGLTHERAGRQLDRRPAHTRRTR